MKSPPAHRVLAASHKYMSLYGLSGTLKSEIRLTREIRCGLFFLMKANIFIQFKGSEG